MFSAYVFPRGNSAMYLSVRGANNSELSVLQERSGSQTHILGLGTKKCQLIVRVLNSCRVPLLLELTVHAYC